MLDSAHGNAVDGDDISSIRLGLVHLVVDSHLVRLIVHGFAWDLVVDVFRIQAVIAT